MKNHLALLLVFGCALQIHAQSTNSESVSVSIISSKYEARSTITDNAIKEQHQRVMQPAINADGTPSQGLHPVEHDIVTPEVPATESTNTVIVFKVENSEVQWRGKTFKLQAETPVATNITIIKHPEK